MDEIRNCQTSDVENIASLWHIAWHSAHGAIVPAELVKLRTLDSFIQRTGDLVAQIRIGGLGAVQGFSITREGELYQLYVSTMAQGTGLAKLLIDDAEARIRADGYSHSWLICAVGNDRAAAFYRKCGWELIETETHELDTLGDAFLLDCWRFEKAL